MEKASIKSKTKFRNRLLILFACVTSFNLFPAAAKPLSHAALRELLVEPDTQPFFTAQENGYTLKIPDYEPSKIQTELLQLPSGVQLVSSKKEEYVDSDGSRGTSVHLWFSFKDTGPVKMPPLVTMIGNRTYYLSFAPAIVYENPAVISPVMEVEFEQGLKEEKSIDGVRYFSVHAGEEIVFSINLKYFVQIIQFSWKLPKNSIFSELERFEITRGVPAGTGFSAEAHPVVRFSWKPLVEGVYGLPDIYLYATAYNGGRKVVPVPACQIKVLPELKKGTQEKLDRKSQEHFAAAFTELKEELNEAFEAPVYVTKENCLTLAQYRSKERNSFLRGDAAEERKQFELFLGLNNGVKEVRKPLILVLICVTAIVMLLFVIFWIFEKTKAAVITLMVAAAMIFGSVRGIIDLSQNYGIFAGGEIKPVPEEITTPGHKTEGGHRVRIVEKAGDYYYIESADVNGWVRKELIFEIR